MIRTRPALGRIGRLDTSTILVTILAVSVLLCVGVALYLGDALLAPPMLTDQRSYRTLGTRLISGHGFSFPTG